MCGRRVTAAQVNFQASATILARSERGMSQPSAARIRELSATSSRGSGTGGPEETGTAWPVTSGTLTSRSRMLAPRPLPTL